MSTRGRDARERNRYLASGSGPYQTLPLVVLVNDKSASAAEIVAACLQDHHRATVVGERTWGKGTVQNVIPLEGGKSLLKLTIASYWRPSGKNIHRSSTSQATDDWGVQPDPGCEVEPEDKPLAATSDDRKATTNPSLDEPAEAATSPVPSDPKGAHLNGIGNCAVRSRSSRRSWLHRPRRSPTRPEIWLRPSHDGFRAAVFGRGGLIRRRKLCGFIGLFRASLCNSCRRPRPLEGIWRRCATGAATLKVLAGLDPTICATPQSRNNLAIGPRIALWSSHRCRQRPRMRL